jgi:hypothetical protein
MFLVLKYLIISVLFLSHAFALSPNLAEDGISGSFDAEKVEFTSKQLADVGVSGSFLVNDSIRSLASNQEFDELADVGLSGSFSFQE